jgi:tRNA modification GTPase
VAAPRKTDTIAAVATPPGTGGIGIIRISGPRALSILCHLFRSRQGQVKTSFQSHKLYYGTLVRHTGRVLDEVLAVYMRAPATYTREDVVELHSHGSWLVLQTVLEEVFRAGARPAEPGEFTKRAFLAGRIDLTQAEAVIDLLAARTTGGVDLAVEQMQGRLKEELEPVQKALARILAVVEVAIDFPEDDVEILESRELCAQLESEVLDRLDRLLLLADQGRVVREGVQVVIAGRPNVGKSSLLNALLREERALVTDIPGTTRDTIEELISLHGIPVHLVDTAGIHEQEDLVESLGIERARDKLDQADLVLFLIDARAGATKQDIELYELVREKEHLVLLNKMDLVAEEELDTLAAGFATDRIVPVSARTGRNIDALQEAIYRVITADMAMTERPACAPNTRHRTILEKARAACLRLREALKHQAPADLVAVEIQESLDILGDIVGLTTPDDVLDIIFSEFCIGK